MDNKKVIGKAIRTVTKSANSFELKKFRNVFYVYVNGRLIVWTNHEDIANEVFTALIAKF